MAPLNVTVHNAVGTDFVIFTLNIVSHDYHHLYIIPSNKTFTLDID